jgi:tryptophan-rich sensory protein
MSSSHSWLRLRRLLPAASFAAAGAAPALSQVTPTHAQPENTFLHVLLIVGVFVAIWAFLYLLIYPLLLPYYRPDASKILFWLLFFLYSVSWLQVVLYTFFDYGFRYVWIGAFAVVLGVLFLISSLVVLIRHPG